MRDDRSEFERMNEERPPSLIAEFIAFMKEEKAWWMAPILISLLLLGILVFFSSTGVAPFIYTLF